MTERQKCREELNRQLFNLKIKIAKLYREQSIKNNTLTDEIVAHLTDACVCADKLQFLFVDEIADHRDEYIQELEDALHVNENYIQSLEEQLKFVRE